MELTHLYTFYIYWMVHCIIKVFIFLSIHFSLSFVFSKTRFLLSKKRKKLFFTIIRVSPSGGLILNHHRGS